MAPPSSSSYIKQLEHINFDVSDLYFPLFILQLRYDVFPLRNRGGNNNQKGNHYQTYNQNQMTNNNAIQQQMEACYEKIEEGEDEALYHEYLRQLYENSNKVFFILRDHFLLIKISITGTIVF
jgi:hypothetical protein